MDIDDLFSSPQNLLASAYEHIDEVGERLRRAFDDGRPHIVVESDPKTGDQIHWFRIDAVIEPQVPVRIFNAVTELRAALDHAVYATSIALGDRETYKRTGFCFGDDETAFESEIDKRCQHVPDEGIALMRALKPYKGGNEALWRLNKLRNVKDHRQLLVPLGYPRFPGLKAKIILPDDYAGPVPPRVTWGRVAPDRDDQVAFLRVSAGAIAKYDLYHSMTVLLGEPEEVSGLEVMDVLAHGREAVDRAVGWFKRGVLAYLEQRKG